MQESKIIVVGYSGHSYVLIDSLIHLGYTILGYADVEIKKYNPYKLKYLGNENDPNFKYLGKNYSYAVAIGNNALRTSIAKFLRSKSCKLINVIHSDSSISNNVFLGSGIFIARNVSINPLTKIEDDVIINTSVTIDHECSIGNGSNISPGAVLSGNVKVGKKTFIGANCVIKQGVIVGDDVIIGAGSVVLKNVSNNQIIYGNPAK